MSHSPGNRSCARTVLDRYAHECRLNSCRQPRLRDSPMSDRPCEQVTPTTGILGSLVGFTFDLLDDCELRRSQGLDHGARCMEPKVQVDRGTEEVVQVDDLGPHVERHQGQSAKAQDPSELKQDSVELA